MARRKRSGACACIRYVKKTRCSLATIGVPNKQERMLSHRGFEIIVFKEPAVRIAGIHSLHGELQAMSRYGCIQPLSSMSYFLQHRM